MRITPYLVGAFAAACFFCGLSAHETAPARPRMEVVFVLDTTGSMGGMIAGAKQKIWAIANKLKSAEPTPEIRFGLVGYRDRRDAYVTKVFGLTGNLDDVYTNLHAFAAEGGGDEPESVNEALHKAVRDLQWSTDSEVLRVIFLVGDARPHMDYQDDVKYQQTCKLANERGIIINTLQCGNLSGTEEVWREIARLTNGTYAAILQDGGSIKIETPYDQEIIRLNLQLDTTIILYGSKADQANAAKNKSVLASLSSEAMADRSSYFGKGEAGSVISGRGDLVVELMNGRQSLDKIDEKQLDPKLQALPVAERNALIEKKVAERRALQAELSALVAKRDAVVAEKLKSLEGKDDVLELNAFQVLESQAKQKGYRFEKKR
ncbi:MAG TPA: vWA domain-containing protein [Lacunisphaera sp.]